MYFSLVAVALNFLTLESFIELLSSKPKSNKYSELRSTKFDGFVYQLVLNYPKTYLNIPIS
jgi:hypothetical protein